MRLYSSAPYSCATNASRHSARNSAGRSGWSGIKAGVAKFGPVTAQVQELTILGGLQVQELSMSVAPQGTTCPAPAAPVGAPT